MRYRKKQREAIEKAIEAFGRGYENVLLDLPTGIGKSLVCYEVAKHFRNALYTTPQVVLLDQIERDELLPNIAVIKGRSNYKCAIDSKKTAANGPCKTKRGFVCTEECEYKVKKMIALQSNISAMSFAYLIYDRYLPEDYSFGNRELLIVDEGDDLESWAVEFGSFIFKVKQEFKTLNDVIAWAKAVRSKVIDKISEIESYSVITDDEVKELEKLRKYLIKLDVFLSRVEKEKRNWVFDCKNGKLILEPVKVGGILRDLVWCRRKKRLVSSATIIDRKMFCETAGLDYKKTVIIKAGSIFKVENRPVYYWPIVKMDLYGRISGYNDMANAVEKIINKYGRVLVHCHAYSIAENIFKRISVDGVRVGIHDSNSRKRDIKRFIRGELDVLISVGFGRGIDLKGDLCRCQVITKVPWPSIESPRVRELWVNRKAWNWARYTAIRNLVQMSGRIVRSEDDWGHTYILDRSFEYLYRYKSQFPKYFLEAVQVIGDIKEVV